MTRLTDQDVAEFGALIREEYGITLTPSEARTKAEEVMRFALLLLHPPKKKQPP